LRGGQYLQQLSVHLSLQSCQLLPLSFVQLQLILNKPRQNLAWSRRSALRAWTTHAATALFAVSGGGCGQLRKGHCSVRVGVCFLQESVKS
jgi:hypothetical protein